MEGKINNPSEVEKQGREAEPKDKKTVAAQQEVHEEWDQYEPGEGSCGDGPCKIPDGGGKTREGSEKPDLGPEWKVADIKTLDTTTKKGDIILVGASWCSACSNAKKDLPTQYPEKTLLYIDYDADSDTVEAKFKDLGGNLPGKYECNGPSSYRKLG